MRFSTEKGLALCGLACVLCREEECPGCRARGCAKGSDCSVYRCVSEKGLDGCYQCDAFPCEENMLQGIRNRAFNRYARTYGKQALLDRLRINFENGITYHTPDGLAGDYDRLAREDEVLHLLHIGQNPYLRCPEYETEHFLLRLVKEEDAADLLACYADEKAWPIFNADSCTGDFHICTPEDMRTCIQFWLKEYTESAYVRFAIVDKQTNRAVGTIEMFGKIGQYNTPRGLLRLDMASPYENTAHLHEILSLCKGEFFKLFDVSIIVTKAIPAAQSRIRALTELGFSPYDFPGREDYWGLHRV